MISLDEGTMIPEGNTKSCLITEYNLALLINIAILIISIHIERLYFCLNLSCSYEISIWLMASLKCCESKGSSTSIIIGFRHFITIYKSIDNEDPI